MKKPYYVYDVAGDDMTDDCLDLGTVDAISLVQAYEIAAKIWKDVTLRIVEVY